MDFASNLTIDQTFTNICFPACCLQGSSLLSLSFRRQGGAILSLSDFAEGKGSCLPALCFPFSPQPPVLSPHKLEFSSFAPQSPSFMFSQLMSNSLASLYQSILLHLPVSPSPCEASCVLGLLPAMQLLPVHVSSSKLIPGIFIPSSGGSFHAFTLPV